MEVCLVLDLLKVLIAKIPLPRLNLQTEKSLSLHDLTGNHLISYLRLWGEAQLRCRARCTSRHLVHLKAPVL